jgi:hypothetical protein
VIFFFGGGGEGLKSTGTGPYFMLSKRISKWQSRITAFLKKILKLFNVMQTKSHNTDVHRKLVQDLTCRPSTFLTRASLFDVSTRLKMSARDG